MMWLRGFDAAAPKKKMGSILRLGTPVWGLLGGDLMKAASFSLSPPNAPAFPSPRDNFQTDSHGWLTVILIRY